MRKDLEKVESVLRQRKIELEEKFEFLSKETTTDGQVHDAADEAMFSMTETLKASLQTNEYEEYKMILKALEQIQNGDYGICVDCQEQISSKRLSSYPNAARCVLCQEALEENQHTYREEF
jgi:DnaK suppressor protein